MREQCSTSSNLKSSAYRVLKQKLSEGNSSLDSDLVDSMFPKKGTLTQYKHSQHSFIYCRDDGLPVLFQRRDGPVMPCLRLVHMYPSEGWTSIVVDGGAIPFVLGGANIMYPGIKDPASSLSGMEEGAMVLVRAENKEHPLAVGVLMLPGDEAIKKNGGAVVKVEHFLGDALFREDRF